MFLWWPGFSEIGMSSIDIGLIECNPKTHVHAACFDNDFCVAFKVFRETGRHDAAFLCEPERESPVPEGDERFHTASTEGEDDLPVVLDGRLVEFTFAWLDAGPFDGEAMGIVSERGCKVKVGFVSRIMFASSAGDIGVWVCCLRSECVPIRIPAKSLF